MDFQATDEQFRLIEAPSDSQLLVQAGAGTGKTEALVYRLDRMLGRDEISRSEVLVLSFSRAAVRELQERLRRSEGETRYLRAATFDRFATKLLARCLPADSFQTLGYDERIERATRLIKEDSGAQAEVDRFRHIVIDELQDLVGCRAEMVKQILSRFRGGFTLLGDPAQGIYDWLVADRDQRSHAFWSWVRQRYASGLETLSFTQNFRFETKNAAAALWARPELVGDNADFSAVLAKLRETLRGLNSFTLTQAQAKLRRAGNLAILCRTNGDAAVLSRRLFELGINHQVQLDQTDGLLPSWLALAV